MAELTRTLHHPYGRHATLLIPEDYGPNDLGRNKFEIQTIFVPGLRIKGRFPLLHSDSLSEKQRIEIEATACFF